MQAINVVLERNPAAFDAKFRETEVQTSGLMDRFLYTYYSSCLGSSCEE